MGLIQRDCLRRGKATSYTVAIFHQRGPLRTWYVPVPCGERGRVLLFLTCLAKLLMTAALKGPEFHGVFQRELQQGLGCVPSPGLQEVSGQGSDGCGW